MSKKVLMFLLVCLFLVSFNGLAKDFEIVGGYYYTVLDPALNKYIEEYNTYIEDIISLNEEMGYTFTTKDITPLKKINQASGYYIGISTSLQNLIHNVPNDNIFITGQYETFSDNKKGTLYTEWIEGSSEGYTEVEINVGIEVKGLYGDIYHRVNDYIDFSGGIGYYTGSVDNYGYFDFNGGKDELDFSTDLKGTVGYKLGANLHHKINDNLNFLCSINYRHLKMDLEDVINLDSSEYPFAVYIPSVDLSGFESKFGLSYNF